MTPLPLLSKREASEVKDVCLHLFESSFLSGVLARKPSAVIPKRFVKGGYDDATNVFTPGRWERMPVGPPSNWWHELPLKWPDLMPEWGAKVIHAIC